MGEDSAISWCTHTFNFWEGCEKISPGCRGCYAEARNKRWHAGKHWGPADRTPRLMRAEAYWKEPMRWAKNARAAGVRAQVFASSVSDFFEDHPDVAVARDRAWGVIAQTLDTLDWLLLTKRPGNMAAMVPWGSFGVTPAQYMAGQRKSMDVVPPWPGVWGGVTTEDQEHLDARLRILLGDETYKPQVEFVTTFASYEPALEPVRFDGPGRNWLKRTPVYEYDRGGTEFAIGVRPRLDWIVCGDESGPKRRPVDIAAIRSVRDQVAAANATPDPERGPVVFHFKQWCGDPVPGVEGERTKGRDGKIHLPVLDGVRHDGRPT